MQEKATDAPATLHEVFEADWVDAFGAELRASDAYRQAAATWEGSIVLREADGGARTAGAEGAASGTGGRAVFLDLHHGACRDARLATAEDLATADFVLRGEYATWKRVLEGSLEPLFGVMSGKLKLERGSVSKLTPHLAAARELVRAAGRVPTRFP